MTRRSIGLASLALCCACAAPRANAPRTTETATPEPAAPPTAEHPEAETVSTTERVLLEGRFSAAIAASTVLTPSDAYSDRGPSFDSFDLEQNGCLLSLALRSDGRVRPAALQPEGAERWLDPAPEGLAILVLPERTYSTLGDDLAAVGAVVFEDDGSATDLFVWPRLPPGEEPVEPEDDEEWVDAQRRDPRISNCFGEATRWLASLLPSLRVLGSFSSPSEITFGWDDAREMPAHYRATLPPGWVLTRAPAYDAEFTYLHRRAPWERTLQTPTPNACLWTFEGEEPPVARGPRHQVLGHSMRFDAEGCGGIVLGEVGVTQHLCLNGNRTERAELLEILATFRPITPLE